MVATLLLGSCRNAPPREVARVDAASDSSPAAPPAAAPPTTGPQRSAAAPDSVRGVVSLTGAQPHGTYVLEHAGTAFALVGDTSLFASINGFDVRAEGRRTGRINESAGPRGLPEFDVTRLFVRAVAGEPAIDGILRREGASWILVLADGSRRTIPHLPAALEVHENRRIYLTGSLDRPPSSYGRIGR